MQWTMASCLVGLSLMMIAGVRADDPSSGPETAILSFAEAYENGDFAGAFLMLAPEAQEGFWTTVSQGAIGTVFPEAGMLEIDVAWPLDEQAAFTAYMEAAAAANVLPFSMPDVRIAGATVDEPEVAIHLVETGGDPEILVIQTNRTKKGWRVKKISWSRSDGQTLPWGVR